MYLAPHQKAVAFCVAWLCVTAGVLVVLVQQGILPTGCTDCVVGTFPLGAGGVGSTTFYDPQAGTLIFEYCSFGPNPNGSRISCSWSALDPSTYSVRHYATQPIPISWIAPDPVNGELYAVSLVTWGTANGHYNLTEWNPFTFQEAGDVSLSLAEGVGILALVFNPVADVLDLLAANGTLEIIAPDLASMSEFHFPSEFDSGVLDPRNGDLYALSGAGAFANLTVLNGTTGQRISFAPLDLNVPTVPGLQLDELVYATSSGSLFGFGYAPSSGSVYFVTLDAAGGTFLTATDLGPGFDVDEPAWDSSNSEFYLAGGFDHAPVVSGGTGAMVGNLTDVGSPDFVSYDPQNRCLYFSEEGNPDQTVVYAPGNGDCSPPPGIVSPSAVLLVLAALDGVAVGAAYAFWSYESLPPPTGIPARGDAPRSPPQ